MTKKFTSGAVTAIFLAVIALVLTLILAATQSQLLLSVRRSQSAVDILVATYNAESEVNDIMAKLMGGYLDDSDIPRYTKNVGDVRLEIEGQDLGETQIITVTAFRGYAVGKVQATRRIASVQGVNAVEIVLMLDCTGSMDAGSGTPGKTRFNAQEEAAINFVNKLAELPDADKFKLGVGIFGISSGWLKHNGVDITPDSGATYPQIATAIADGFGDTRNGSPTRSASPACATINTSGTNVGIAFRHAHSYLENVTAADTKRIEVVITDGEPNSRTPDSECPPSITCGPEGSCEPAAKNYLRCAVADRDTFVSEIGYNGVRDPDIDAYAVTIFDRPPGDVVTIFQKYATPDGYFNAGKANELTNILEGILVKILEDRSTVTVKRIIPTPQ